MFEASLVMERNVGVICVLISSFLKAAQCTLSDNTSSHTWFHEHTVALGVVSVVTLILLSVFLVSLCGGCTDMEVGSENHPAAGGSSNRSSGYNAVVTDTNTQVMYSSHSFGDSANPPQSQMLPYSLNPSGVTSAQGFTGYQAVPSQDPQPNQGRNPYNAQPYGNQGFSQPTGYSGGTAQTPSAPAIPTPGAHRPAVEPPPPSYNESVMQSYQWR